MATPSENLNIDTLIGANSTFKGELSFQGAVRIDGKFEGNITASKDGTLIVSEGAFLQGEVRVPNLILHGTIRGNVHAGNSLKIGAKGQLNGDVEYAVITLSEGAAVNGRCNRITDKERIAKPGEAAATPATPQPEVKRA